MFLANHKTSSEQGPFLINGLITSRVEFNVVDLSGNMLFLCLLLN